MKYLIVILILIAGRALGGDYPLDEHRKLIAETLGKEWIVTVHGDAIEIKSTFMVYWVGLISRASAPPEFRESTPRSVLAKESKRESYVIRLEYSNHLLPEELQRRIAERRKYADVIDTGSKTKDDFGNAQKGLARVRLPRYTLFAHEIYRVVPDNGSAGSSQIYPPSAVGKIGAAKELIDAVIGNRNLYAFE